MIGASNVTAKARGGVSGVTRRPTNLMNPGGTTLAFCPVERHERREGRKRS
jgi:hypothetical protein